MRIFIVIAFIVFVYILSAVMHEADLSRNYNNTGDARSWFFDIKR